MSAQIMFTTKRYKTQTIHDNISKNILDIDSERWKHARAFSLLFLFLLVPCFFFVSALLKIGACRNNIQSLFHQRRDQYWIKASLNEAVFPSAKVVEEILRKKIISPILSVGKFFHFLTIELSKNIYWKEWTASSQSNRTFWKSWNKFVDFEKSVEIWLKIG